MLTSTTSPKKIANRDNKHNFNKNQKKKLHNV